MEVLSGLIRANLKDDRGMGIEAKLPATKSTSSWRTEATKSTETGNKLVRGAAS